MDNILDYDALKARVIIDTIENEAREIIKNIVEQSKKSGVFSFNINKAIPESVINILFYDGFTATVKDDNGKVFTEVRWDIPYKPKCRERFYKERSRYINTTGEMIRLESYDYKKELIEFLRRVKEQSEKNINITTIDYYLERGFINKLVEKGFKIEDSGDYFCFYAIEW